MVPDTDDPLRLNKAWRLLAGREAQGGASAVAYGLPLRFAEGEEHLRGLSGSTAALETAGVELLDPGQRLRPDGSEFNVIRLHRVFNMQSSGADKAGELTMERMLDEFVTLTIRSAFFDKQSAKEDDTSAEEFVLRGRPDVFRYLINDGFAALKAKGPTGKKKEEVRAPCPPTRPRAHAHAPTRPRAHAPTRPRPRAHAPTHDWQPPFRRSLARRAITSTGRAPPAVCRGASSCSRAC